MSRKWIIAGVSVLILAAAFVSYYHRTKVVPQPSSSSYRSTTVTLGGVVLRTRIADTDALRTQGLSGTKELAPDEAMLFTFDTLAMYGFWMKDMNYSIDIIWLDANKHIVYIKEHALPESYPAIYSPKTSALYVIEVPDGFSNAHELKVGYQVLFSL
jgi:uncharacterized membrane protein (UPF0127 family)